MIQDVFTEGYDKGWDDALSLLKAKIEIENKDLPKDYLLAIIDQLKDSK